MTRVLLMIVRFALSAWVGAATLFVVSAIRQVTSDQFDTVTKGQLALLRFPPFYLFGFVLTGLGALPLAGLWATGRLPCGRWKLAALASLTAVAVMAYDYTSIYRPLVTSMGAPNYVETPEFLRLHDLSEAVNTAQLSLVLLAALLVNWPAPFEQGTSERG